MLAKEVLYIYLEKPLKAKDLNAQIVKESKEFFAIMDQIGERIKQTDGASPLFLLWHEAYEKYAWLHRWGWLHTLLDFKDILFTQHLMAYTEKKVNEKSYATGTSTVFSILTTPTQKTILTEEVAAFGKIITFAKKDCADSEQVKEMIKQHAYKYGWLGFGWTGPAWDEDHFKKALAQETEHQDISETKRQQQKICAELDIDEKHQLYFQLAREVVHGKEYRKEAMFYCAYILDKLLTKLSTISGVDKNILRFVYPYELKGCELDAGFIDKLQQRWDFHVNQVTETEDRIYTGQEAKEFLQRVPFKKVTAQEEVKGFVAFPGNVRGKVKIVNVKEDIPQMEEGNILVSISTNPDLLPAMKKAAAIVTDVGGITCHAAIVSRELKIPCVVGTNSATSSFKDGDFVEVDAKKGIVRKVEGAD
ncbi:hypothetical protein KY362_00745 [Candidatus Woesearchaeota archaeon]|nr:hypothetical protein [Candidatus Woesearchaeota archaeon]